MYHLFSLCLRLDSWLYSRQEVDEAGRLEALHRFQEGKVSILLCSDLLSRGIDTSKAAVVVNYEFPNNTRCGFNECLL